MEAAKPVTADGSGSRLDERLLTTQTLAEYLEMSPTTLRIWRSRGIGPRAFKIGKSVRWRRSDVDMWLEEQREPAA